MTTQKTRTSRRRLGVSQRARRICTAAAAAAVLAGTFGAAQPAQAASVGYIYIAFPKWLGNCPNGGNVTRIWATDGLSTWNWDAGDDLVYGKAMLNSWNSVQYTLFCQTSWYGLGYYQPGATQNFYPTRNNQTVWVGPFGWTSN